ncbi:hypothetical protein Q5M85_06780 [Paraclostridium bifermentans]|nr:hypothetical protein [Paraclostridium bifermentans]
MDSLDEDGYLRFSKEIMLNELKELNVDEDTFLECLEKVQQLDPIEVGARDLVECLILQIENSGEYDEDLINIIKEDLDLIASNKVKEISKNIRFRCKDVLI